jgi:hypothetical protein
MTNEQKKKVFEYMGWYMSEDTIYKILNAADMVAAINKMGQNDNEWICFLGDCQFAKAKSDDWIKPFIVWLCGNPERFFSLMGEWLEVKG